MNNKDITVVSDNGLYSQTKPMESSNYIIFELPWLGTYYIRWIGPSGTTIQQTAVVQTVGGVTSTAAIPRITIINGNRTMDGKSFKVKNGSEVYNLTMPAADSIDVSINGLGTYSIIWTSDLLGTQSTNTVVVSNTIGSSSTLSFENSYPSFSGATDAQLASAVQAHYNNLIDISTIWSVGDTRTINLSSMSTCSGINETQSTQTAQLVILDFNHDDLYSSINGHTKAAVSIQLKNSLQKTGPINSTTAASLYWFGTGRRLWCDDVFYYSLPSGIKNIVKKVTKSFCNGKNSSSGNVTYNTYYPYCWLVSYTEITGSGNGHSVKEGSQYPYYKTASNAFKRLGNNGSTATWWTRTKYYPGTGNYATYDYYGSDWNNRDGDLSGSRGISPGFCI